MTQPQGDKKPKAPAARTHPDERPRIDALNMMGKALTPAPTEKPPKSYYTPVSRPDEFSLLCRLNIPYSGRVVFRFGWSFLCAFPVAQVGWCSGACDFSVA